MARLRVCAPRLSTHVYFGQEALTVLTCVRALVASSPACADIPDLISTSRVGLAVAWAEDEAVGFACGAYSDGRCHRLVRLGVAEGMDAGMVIRTLSDALMRTPWGRSPENGRADVAWACPEDPDTAAWKGAGAWTTNRTGRRVLDARAGLTGHDLGYDHPSLVRSRAALHASVTRRRSPAASTYHRFARDLAVLCRMDFALPVPTPADALLVAGGLARQRGCARRNLPEGLGEIIRVDSSDTPDLQGQLGGGRHVQVPFGDLPALASAVTPRTVAVVVPPLPVTPRVMVPPDEYLAGVRALCDRHGLLMIADESVSGLARTGALTACELDDVTPDMLVLGSCLGAGLVPLAAVVARDGIISAADASSLAEGLPVDPLVCALGRVVVKQLKDGSLARHATQLGYRLALGLSTTPGIAGFRCRGLWASVDVEPCSGTAPEVERRLLRTGVLVQPVSPTTLLIAPPLVTSELEVDFLLAQLRSVLTQNGAVA